LLGFYRLNGIKTKLDNADREIYPPGGYTGSKAFLKQSRRGQSLPALFWLMDILPRSKAQTMSLGSVALMEGSKLSGSYPVLLLIVLMLSGSAGEVKSRSVKPWQAQ
jgi:hypothetical protein